MVSIKMPTGSPTSGMLSLKIRQKQLTQTATGQGNNADSDDDGDGYVDVFEDFAGADSLDSTDAEISESFAKEMALPILDLEREKGISAVTSNPSSYSLYTASDVSVAEATARTAGQSDVTSDPSSYSLYTATDLSAAEAAARTLGQQDVTASPETYELATMAQISAAAEAARTIVNVSARVAPWRGRDSHSRLRSSW